MTLSGASTRGQSGPGSDGNEGALDIPQSSSINRTLQSDCLVSYLRRPLVWNLNPLQTFNRYILLITIVNIYIVLSIPVKCWSLIYMFSIIYTCSIKILIMIKYGDMNQVTFCQSRYISIMLWMCVRLQTVSSNILKDRSVIWYSMEESKAKIFFIKSNAHCSVPI